MLPNNIVGDDRTLTVEEQEPLGSGVSGSVYKLRNHDKHNGLPQLLARKVIWADEKTMPQPQEAIVVAGLLRDGLNNDNLIKVFRHGRIDGRHYGIDMELCDFDMHQYIKQRRLRSHGSMRGKRGPYEIIQITKQVAGGLAFIHRHQLVHRDVKPKNILYSAAGNLWKITDLGITTAGSSGPDSVTYRGRGTPDYLSPEFQRDRTFNYHTDMWALGCVIYELATGDLASSVYPLARDPKEEFPRKLFPFAGAEAEFIFGMIQALLHIQPGERPTSKNLVEHIHDHVFDDKIESQDFAYNFDDNPWLRKVGKKVHHVRRLAAAAGSSGSDIHLVQNVKTGAEFVRKLTSAFGDNEHTIAAQRKQFREGFRNRSPYIVDILGMDEIGSREPKYFYIDMEVCDSDLAQFIRSNRPDEFQLTPSIPQRQVWEIMNAVANAVRFVHEQNFTICDLRPSKSTTYPCRWMVSPVVLYFSAQSAWKLGDFSLTAMRGGRDENIQNTDTLRWTDGQRPPEIASSSSFNNKVDIWGIGCIFYELITGDRLFRGDWELRDYANRREEPSDVPQTISRIAKYMNETLAPLPWRSRIKPKQYFLHIFAVQPSQRPTARELVAEIETILKR